MKNIVIWFFAIFIITCLCKITNDDYFTFICAMIISFVFNKAYGDYIYNSIINRVSRKSKE